MFRRPRKQNDFTAEIESHLRLEADRLREEGLSAVDAEKAARLKFGNVLQTQERFYESQRNLWLEGIRREVRYAIRSLRHAPMFTATVVLTLALGIGATAAIFGVADAALIRPLPFPQAQRLVSVYERWQGELDNLAPASYLDYRRQAKSFEELAGYRQISFNLGGENRPERVLSAVVTPNFFAVMEVSPELGRTLDATRDKPGSLRALVLAYSLWKRRYAGSTDVIGRTVSVNGEPGVIVGVMPPDFTYPGKVEMWAAARYQVPEHPLRPEVDQSTSRSSHYFDIVGRLKAGVTTQEAQAEVDVISRRLKQEYKDAEEGDGTTLVSLRDDLVGNTRPAILVLFGGVAVLFLIACANVANMVLARGATRQREIAIRGSLGAGRLRLIRQLIVESFLLSLLGTTLGLGGARYALRSLETLLPADLVGAGGLHLEPRLLAFAAVAAVLSTILFGIVPAIQAAKVDLNSALKEGGRTSAGGVQANRSRKALVITQIALAAVLLNGAGLLVRSFERLLAAPTGFSPDHVLSFQLSLPAAQYRTPADMNRFAAGVLENVRSVPGVTSSAVASWLPMSGGSSQRGIEIKGRPPVPGEDISPAYMVISPEYFRTLRIPVLDGRVFTDRDAATARGAVIINAAMVRHFWPRGDAVGKYVKIDRLDWSPVVGVVADVAQQGLDKAPRPTVYVPYAQDPWRNLGVVIRTAMDPKHAAAAAIRAVHHVDKDEPVYQVRTMDETIASSVQARRFRTSLLALFAALALALATVGIYGVMAYGVAQRGHEIGIRMALGARPTELRRLIVGEGMRLAGYGIAAGLLASLGLMRVLSGVLYGVRSSDPPTFTATFLFLIVAAFLASYVPARRGMRIDAAIIWRTQ